MDSHSGRPAASSLVSVTQIVFGKCLFVTIEVEKKTLCNEIEDLFQRVGTCKLLVYRRSGELTEQLLVISSVNHLCLSLLIFR